jgi:hypothetical protein
MDTATANAQGRSERTYWRTTMKNFENNLRKDTILNTGLLAIAIAWVALAAVQVPMARASDGAAAISRNGACVDSRALARACADHAVTASATQGKTNHRA